MKPYLYSFAPSHVDVADFYKDLLGGKGAGLAEMCSLGLPVPPGCTLTTDLYHYFVTHKAYPAELDPQLKQALQHMEDTLHTGARFGSAAYPLLLSVRSGAPVSMPGMMDTILNLGLNDQTVLGLIEQTKDPRFA